MRSFEVGIDLSSNGGNGVAWAILLSLLLDVESVVCNASPTLMASLSIRIVDKFSAVGFVFNHSGKGPLSFLGCCSVIQNASTFFLKRLSAAILVCCFFKALFSALRIGFSTFSCIPSSTPNTLTFGLCCH